MTSLTSRERWALLLPLRLQRLLILRAAKQSPAAFRRHLRLVPPPAASPAALDQTVSVSNLLQPWQERDFAALDRAWLKLAGHPVAACLQRAWIERPRGHAKTSDMAVQIAWVLLHARTAVHGLAAAADRDQANLLWDAVLRLTRLNPLLCEGLEFRKHHIANSRTGSQLEIISSDVHSSWGALVDFIICDELCHWDKPEMWHSLLSSAAKKPHCVLVVLTNAGSGRGWQWEAREAARSSPRWYFSSLEGSQAPWITPEALAEQQALLPRPVYLRLWQNQWQHSDGQFVTLAEAEACRDESLSPQSHGQPHLHYIAAVDYAEKHDHTVALILHSEPIPASQSSPFHSQAASRLVIDRIDVVAPTPERPTPVAWVEQWIYWAAAQFPHITFIVDEYQLLGTIQQLQQRVDIRRFPFQSGKGNHALALTLRKLILHRQLAWYRGCGQLAPRAALFPAAGDFATAAVEAHRDDLETELASLLLRESPTGLCRIDHLRDGQHHDDRSFTLGAAALHAVTTFCQSEFLEITPPVPGGDFDWPHS